jgi:hypothetical protein
MSIHQSVRQAVALHSAIACYMYFTANTRNRRKQYIWMPEGAGRHAEGVAQIIRLRGCAETSQDPFESNLLLSLRAVVVSEGDGR